MYTFDDLKAGEWMLRASYADTTQTVRCESNWGMTYRESIVLAVPGRVLGRVVDVRGLPIQGAVVSLIDDSGVPQQKAETGRNGKVSFDGVIAGHYDLNVVTADGEVTVQCQVRWNRTVNVLI